VGIVVLLVILAATDSEEPAATALDAGAIEQEDSGATVVASADAGETDVVVEPSVPVLAMTDEQVTEATASWKDAGLHVTGFSGDLEDEIANGACRYGKVDEVRVLVCLSEGDPVKTSKGMSRPAPGDTAPRKWRSRLRRGDYHLRVQTVGRNKKRKRLRRKIESLFKKS